MISSTCWIKLVPLKHLHFPTKNYVFVSKENCCLSQILNVARNRDTDMQRETHTHKETESYMIQLEISYKHKSLCRLPLIHFSMCKTFPPANSKMFLINQMNVNHFIFCCCDILRSTKNRVQWKPRRNTQRCISPYNLKQLKWSDKQLYPNCKQLLSTLISQA